jgi:hypothetical protein
MSTTQSLWGTNHEVPVTDEINWGGEVSSQLLSLLEGLDETSFKLASGAVAHMSPSADSTLAASATLTQTAPTHLVQGSGGAVTLDGTSAIADGEKDGVKLILEGAHATNTVTILDAANTSMNGLVTLALGETITFRWSAARSVWQEQGRTS